MPDKETSIKIETKLYLYYQKDIKLKSLRNQLDLLDKQINKIEKELKECNISIPDESRSITYEERVQASGDGTSYAEREVMKITEVKLKRITSKKLDKEYISEQIDNIETYSAAIEDIIRPYSDELKKLLEYKYKYHWNETRISSVLHLSQSQINKKKQKVIEDIERWERWNKTGIKVE